MPLPFTRFFQAAQAGLVAARRVYDDPDGAGGSRRGFDRAAEYRFLWALYTGAIFDESWSSVWTGYKGKYGLYRNTRNLIRITTQLVDFYAASVYPGLVTDDGLNLPDGMPSAIPLAQDTKPPLRKALSTLFNWSQMNAFKGRYVRYGGALGNALIEIVDDVADGQVLLTLPWPGQVTAIQRDIIGNLTAYTLQYQVADEDGSLYEYRKVVTPQTITTFKNGQPYDYATGTDQGERPNPYGFCPATWAMHIDLGGDFGAPALRGSLPTQDEANSHLSLLMDQARKVVGAPFVLATEGDVEPLFTDNATEAQPQRAASDELQAYESDRDSVLMLKAPSDATVHHLAGDLQLESARSLYHDLRDAIRDEHPELAFYSQMRQMSQVTGPAVWTLMGDVAQRVIEAQANYDTALIRASQMAVAIGGWRANSGAWGPRDRLTTEQAAFLPFNLDDFQAGRLRFTINPRPLSQPTRAQIADEQLKFWQGVNEALKSGEFDLQYYLEEVAGWPPEKVRRFLAAKERAAAEAKTRLAEAQAAMTAPPGPDAPDSSSSPVLPPSAPPHPSTIPDPTQSVTASGNQIQGRPHA